MKRHMPEPAASQLPTIRIPSSHEHPRGRAWIHLFSLVLLHAAGACAPAGDPGDPGLELGSYDDGGALDDKALSSGSYQAESRTGQSGCVQATNFAGYTGSGFMDFGGNGTWIEWNNISAPEAGRYSLRLRYANGAAGNRAAAILVNGQSIGSVPFAVTGGWDRWGTGSIDVSLGRGNNTIRVLANTSTGGPNIDRMDVVATDICPSDSSKVEPGVCGCGVSDADSDRDGTPDCKDGCKTDPNKTQPGGCGCGVPEGTCQGGFVSRIINYDSNGQLRYSTDAEGNRIPDFSYVGYKYGEELPSTSNLVPANQIRTISPIVGDNTAHIQSAIDEVGAYPVQSNGYRGIVRLKPGTYLTHNPVYVRSSGVILQGAGRGADPTVNTIIKSSRSGKDETVFYLGNPSPFPGWTVPASGSNKTVTSPSIPIGQRSFQVDDASPFRVGDMVVISQALNDSWYSLVDLPRFYTAWNGTEPGNKTWREHGVDNLNVLFVRFIKGISGNQITVDAPFYHRFAQSFGKIQLYKYNHSYDSRTRLYDHIGIDNLHIDIETNGGSDEEHTERAIVVQGAVDSWARNITNLHASEGTVHIKKSTRVTVENCESREPVSIITGGKRSGFAVADGGQQILFKDCIASENRHGFVLSAGPTASGVVFLRGILEKNLETSEAGHQKWSMGALFDNCKLASYQRNWLSAFGAYNRGAWGTTSHGWSAANSVLWNVNAGPDNTIVVQKPPTAQNYAIGCSGKEVSGVGPFQADPGYIEGTGQGAELQIPSLYQAQLNARR